MKILFFSIILVLSVFIACSAQAQLVVYDDFSGALVDTVRWLPFNDIAENVVPYEGGFRILKGKLSFFNRGFGATAAEDETQQMKRRLFLRDVSGVTGIEASIKVAKNGHEITGCPSENGEPSETRIFIGGSFFNNGDGSEPGNGDYTGDIFVGIGLSRYSNSTSEDIPAGYMGVGARVRRCKDANCLDYDQLFETFFPDKDGKPLLLKLGKKEKFRITYDQSNNTFTLQVGKKNIVTYDCDDDNINNEQAPGATKGGMRLEVSHDLANCSTTRSFGWADVVFDDIKVQE